MKKFAVAFITCILFIALFVNFTKAAQPEEEITVKVNCRSPKPGVYTYGWGTLRLRIPETGSPYVTFRNHTSIVEDTLCQAGDNVGVVAFDSDGKVWVYVPALGEQ